MGTARLPPGIAAPSIFALAEEAIMTKSRDSKKDTKKSPMKTIKEKRTEKHLKKNAQLHPDFLVKQDHGSAH